MFLSLKEKNTKNFTCKVWACVNMMATFKKVADFNIRTKRLLISRVSLIKCVELVELLFNRPQTSV